jgi:DNA excision repair protein ERCC-2
MDALNDWPTFFPYASPYDHQVTGIERTIETALENGFHVMEGACGTGKTLIGLTAGLALLEDGSTDYERVVAITSRKQQLAAFEDDLRTVNSELSPSEEFQGLTLVGKADLCPLVQAGHIDDEAIYHRCTHLRNNTAALTSSGDSFSVSEGKRCVEMAKPGRSAVDSNGALRIGDEISPYADDIPEREDDATRGEKSYCPFYAQYMLDSVDDHHPVGLVGHRDADELLADGTDAGTCPHAVMGDVMEEADVVIGNYKYIFNPLTAQSFTSEIIDDETLLIVDEAHTLVPEVRDELGQSVAYRTFASVEQDIQDAAALLGGRMAGVKPQEAAQNALEKAGVEKTDLQDALDFLDLLSDRVRDIIIDEIRDALYQGRADWVARLRAEEELEPTTISLQDDERAGADRLSMWADLKGCEQEWKQAANTLRGVSEALRAANQELADASLDHQTSAALADLLAKWQNDTRDDDSEVYFREIELQPRAAGQTPDQPPEEAPWEVGFTAHLNINNCIPKAEIAHRLDQFGSAVLMSATLAPLDIYCEVTGVNMLHYAQERRVTESVFELGFPNEQRLDLAVSAPKFTYKNRDKDDVQRCYAEAVKGVVTETPGNVLVCMPTYEYAEWMGELLEADFRVDKPVLVDESSTNRATNNLKDSFVDGESKVLTTSLRGTLTEGVDYDGEALAAAVVCGVPIQNTSTDLAGAIEEAYDSEFGLNGYTAAFTVPAVRKARQALGRVIRGADEVGVRALIDERYTGIDDFSDVTHLFPDSVLAEFSMVPPDAVAGQVQQFWDNHDEQVVLGAEETDSRDGEHSESHPDLDLDLGL